jgi:hypothetical protein
MSDTALDWRVVWGDIAGREFRTFHVSRDEALDAACDPGRYEVANRVQGPNGVAIERTEIEQFIQTRSRRAPG